MQFMFQYPETNGTERHLLDAGPVAEVAATAEAAGWMGFSFTEHPVPGVRWLEAGGHQSLDPIVALSFAAAATKRIRLLTYLVVAPYRNPFLLAKAAATIDLLSGGRFTLGLGTGYLKGEFHALGVDFDERNQLFDETLDALPMHWSGEAFSYKGAHFEARDAIARPRPVQDPIPIWIGGNSQLTRRRVAERAQGWMPLLGPPTLNVTARTPALGGLDELAVAIAEVRDAAADRETTIDVLYPYIDSTIASPHDDIERHRAAFAELAEIGVTWVVVSGSTRTPDATRAFLETFGSNYIA
jgi:probable F420-dependent oxidoreductase